ATVSINVARVDQRPVATNDGPFTTVQNAPLTVSAADGVLKNDSDPDGDSIQAFVVTGPAHGSVSLGTDGGFTYTPTTGYSGPDSFTYRANDGTLDSLVPATVLITVRP